MADGNAYDIFAAQFAAHLGSTQNGYCTPSSMWSGPPSPGSDSSDIAGGNDSGDDSKTSSDSKDSKSSKSKRANRYKNCSEAVLSRRRAQNRANQRAYRKRKEQRLAELQEQLDQVNQRNDALTFAYGLLARECTRIKSDGPAPPTWANVAPNTSNLMLSSMPGVPDLSSASATLSVPSDALASPGMFLDSVESPDKMWNPYP